MDILPIEIQNIIYSYENQLRYSNLLDDLKKNVTYKIVSMNYWFNNKKTEFSYINVYDKEYIYNYYKNSDFLLIRNKKNYDIIINNHIYNLHRN